MNTCSSFTPCSTQNSQQMMVKLLRQQCYAQLMTPKAQHLFQTLTSRSLCTETIKRAQVSLSWPKPLYSGHRQLWKLSEIGYVSNCIWNRLCEQLYLWVNINSVLGICLVWIFLILIFKPTTAGILFHLHAILRQPVEHFDYIERLFLFNTATSPSSLGLNISTSKLFQSCWLAGI